MDVKNLGKPISRFLDGALREGATGDPASGLDSLGWATAPTLLPFAPLYAAPSTINRSASFYALGMLKYP